MRTDLFGSVFRIRDKASYAIHKFFQERDYVYAHTPIITGSDCEGAGEAFSLGPEGFFGTEAYLTVSGQLHGETAMMGLGQIYTFGPTFRAEESFTSRHLSEFWMAALFILHRFSGFGIFLAAGSGIVSADFIFDFLS